MRLLVLLAALLCVVAARAQERIVSIDAFQLGYAGGWVFTSDKGKGGTKDRDANEFKLNLNYAQKLPQHPQIMVKGVARIERTYVDQGDDTTNSLWGFSGGVLFNHDATDVKNSMFAGLQAGMERQTIEAANEEATGFNLTLAVEAGKRWDMGQYSVANISYAPSVEWLYRRYGGDIRDEFYSTGTELKLNFLKFDILF